MKIIENNFVVAIDKVKPNGYNPKPDYNSTDELKAEFEKIKNSIRVHGQIDPIQVRELGKGMYEIVNGYHRWVAMKELGFKEIEIKNLGKMSRVKAIMKALSFEVLKIPLDIIESAKLAKEVRDSEEDLSGLPYTPEELENKIRLLEFDWDNFKEIDLLEEGSKEIKKLEGRKRYFFSTDKEGLEKIVAFFKKNSSATHLDGEKLVMLVSKHNGERIRKE